MLNVYETLLVNVKNYFKQSKRTNAELSDKLHEVFQFNNAKFKKLKSIYANSNTSFFEKARYEHYEIENYKKRRYGGEYEIKPFEYD